MILKILDKDEVLIAVFELDYYFKIGNFLNGKCAGVPIKIELDKGTVFLDNSNTANIYFKGLILEKNGTVLIKY